MKISVFGLGYVGCISAACLAKEGHEVIGVDVNQMKVDMMRSGKSPIVEKDINEILQEVVHATGQSGLGSLETTTNATDAVKNTDLSLICVGTPSRPNGSLGLEYVKSCARDIGEGLKEKDDYHVVVGRSTMLPGSIENTIIKNVEEVSGKKAGTDFGAVMNPEFLREGSSVFDFYNPPVTVIGELDRKSGDAVQEMYAFLDAPLVRTDIRTAEMVKYANNTFHGLKVAFANEIGAICKTLNIDSHKVMELFCMDHKLNLSAYYLKPGFAFGGSCLPKDLRAITYQAKIKDVEVPVLQSIMESNFKHIDRAIERIIHSGKKKIGFLGLSFKPGTDDLRESPLVTVIETLIGKGFDIKIYDKNVAVARLFGANREFIEKGIPHISSLMAATLDEVHAHAELLVIGHRSPEFQESITYAETEGKTIYDLARIADELTDMPSGYEGICW